jgi:hypothetical protein
MLRTRATLFDKVEQHHHPPKNAPSQLLAVVMVNSGAKLNMIYLNTACIKNQRQRNYGK